MKEISEFKLILFHLKIDLCHIQLLAKGLSQSIFQHSLSGVMVVVLLYIWNLQEQAHLKSYHILFIHKNIDQILQFNHTPKLRKRNFNSHHNDYNFKIHLICKSQKIHCLEKKKKI